MAQLVVTFPDSTQQTFELTEERLSVGRVSENGICLPETSISSRHAELTRKDQDYVLRDCNSTNGTRVNGQRIVESRLAHGDTVHFASVEARYVSSNKASQPLPPIPKKLVDLSSTATMTGRPTAFLNSSPFVKQDRSQKMNKLFKISVIALSILGAGLILTVIIKILNT